MFILGLTITYEGCDVHGKYRGGFGASGAAIFTTGQICANIVLKNCTFAGELIGFNVALLVANASGCESAAGTSISCENVVNEGTIKAINGQNIYYSSVTNNTNYVVPASGVTGSVEEFNPVITDTITSDVTTKQISISAGADDSATHYELRLSLSSVYWYKGDVNTRRTDSNTQVIQLESCALSDPAIYSDTKVISLVEAKELWNTDWDSCTWGEFESGAKYTHYTADGTNYLVIDYGPYSDEYEFRYYQSTSAGSASNYSGTKIKQFILVGLDDNDYVTSYANTTN